MTEKKNVTIWQQLRGVEGSMWQQKSSARGKGKNSMKGGGVESWKRVPIVQKGQHVSFAYPSNRRRSTSVYSLKDRQHV